jgi:uncharacterized protein (TIGR02271 family)
MGFLKDMKSAFGMGDDKQRHEKDVRGWHVKNESGTSLGKMDDWMVDQDERKLRYGVVDHNDRRVLLPVGDLDYDETNRHVIAKGYDQDKLAKLHPYDANTWNETTERDTYRAHHPDWQGDTLDYDTDRFRAKSPERIQLIEEQLRVDKRPVETGQVQIGKRAVEEQVSEQVELGQERLEINRTPVNKPIEGTAAGLGDNQTINVTLFGEEPVVDKQTFVKEEIDVNKVTDTRTQDVRDTVRREELVTEGMDQHEFASAEPTDTELRDRQRTQKPRVDVTPIDDQSGIDRPI